MFEWFVEDEPFNFSDQPCRILRPGVFRSV